jgi:DNA-directed RNA polymerase subunit N (RpoN/RPB10)
MTMHGYSYDTYLSNKKPIHVVDMGIKPYCCR